MGGDLSRRIWFTLAALVICRLGTYVPIPGIDPNVLADFFRGQTGGPLGMMDVFVGGGFGRLSIFALGLFPYITVGAVVLLASSVSPKLKALAKEGEAGRKRINQYLRYGTVILAAAQAYCLAIGLEHVQAAQGPAVLDPGLLFRMTTAVTLTGGAIFLLWLGEQITGRGVGNGILLIVFSGIAAELPRLLAGVLELGRASALPTGLIIALPLIAAGMIAFILFMERAQRRVFITKIGDRHSHLPMKLNAAGALPALFAFSVLSMLTTISGFSSIGGPGWLVEALAPLGGSETLYLAVYGALIVLFAFLCASQAFDPARTAANLKTAGKVIIGIRPGEGTARYLRKLQVLLTLLAAAYLAAICLLPEFLTPPLLRPFDMSAPALLVLVWVILDTSEQIRWRLQPPPGGPPDDFSGAVGARQVAGLRTKAVAQESRSKSRKGIAAETD